MPVAETEFIVEYDGPALAMGTMPVRDLAPALLALGELFTEVGQVVYPEGKPVTLNIKATGQGSFDVHLLLEASGAWKDFVDVWGGDAVTALVNLKTLIIGGPSLLGFLGFLKWAKGRKVVSQEDSPIPGQVKLTMEDGETIEISAEVIKLYPHFRIRRKAKEVVAPVARQGVNEVRFKESLEAEPDLVVSEADLPAYDMAVTEEEDTLLDEVQEMVVEIVSPVFVEGNKWRLYDGENTLYAAIEDPPFQERVDMGEAFRKGDRLRVRMRVVQKQTPRGLQTERQVLEVLEHYQREEQMRLGEEAES